MKRYAIPIMLFGLTISGCAKTVWVSEDGMEYGKEVFKPVAGIPFYNQKEIFRQETTRILTWFRVTLTVSRIRINEQDRAQDQIEGKQTYLYYVSKENKADIDTVKNAFIGKGRLNVKSIIKATKDLAELSQMPATLQKSEDSEVLSNEIKAEWVVDEGSKYYLNAPLPWFGTGNLTQKLNPNGTLEEVVSSPDTKLAESIASIIPFKEFLTAKHVDPLTKDDDKKDDDEQDDIDVAPVTNDTEQPDPGIEYSVELDTSEIGYKYTFEKIYENRPKLAEPLEFDEDKYSFTREAYSPSSSEGKSKKAEPEKPNNVIGITGTINLPKEAAPKPAE